MIDSIINFYRDSELVQFFFWFPLVFNTCVYPVELWMRYQRDKRAVENNELYYYDFLKMGDVLYCLFLTVTPCINALATIFDAFPTAFKIVFKKFGWLIDIQFVKDTRKKDK